ncbi:MAG: GDP-mannose 4,6-dehydratase [Acidobacteria bacterium]|nr:GDP-mannose 4,6-dehydratase [Candidatus Sulfomarinibacter kjeldsenii]
MRKHVTLITGAGGEIGHGLIERLTADGDSAIITIDLQPLEQRLVSRVEKEYQGSILETHLLERILSEYEVERIYHLAAILSTRAEFTPVTGHQVNVEGTLKLLDFAQAQGESHGRAVVFLYPSSIAAYGLPDLETKAAAGAVREYEWNHPTTMYGCNKLYCEHLGRYLARGESNACFVRPDTRIPFMVMPDAVDALVGLAKAESSMLGRSVYNITAFNPSAEEIRSLVLEGFPDADITFDPDLKRQAIVDSWPSDVDDSAARSDWGLAPRYDLESGFADYLIPRIRDLYRT